MLTSTVEDEKNVLLTSPQVNTTQDGTQNQNNHSATGGSLEYMPGSITRYTPLADISNLPTLLPAPLAAMVTTIATSTRMTLKVTAFIIEAILETSQYTTRISLGYMRRLLITAITSARRVYLMSNAAIEGDLLSLISGGSLNTMLLQSNKTNPSTTVSNPPATTTTLTTTSGTGEGTTETTSKQVIPTTTTTTTSTTTNTTKSGLADTGDFLGILDKYTNLGIYFIHHTFTMVELFTMSGFFFTSKFIESVHTAAIESVALFDSLFGSNESSRSLSAIITMVRKEILQDERIAKRNQSTISSLSGLTKALTAFTCLQVATWNRTEKRLKMKVLYDCTIQAEQSDSYTTSTSTTATTKIPMEPEAEALSIAALEEAPPSLAGPGPSTLESRKESAILLASNPSLEEANKRLWQHMESIESSSSSSQPALSRRTSTQTTNWTMDDLDNLVGESGEEIYDRPPDDRARESHQKERKDLISRESTVEITDELTESTVITHLVESIQRDMGNDEPLQRHPALGHRRQYSMPEIGIRPLDDDEDQDYLMRSAATSVSTSPKSSLISVFTHTDDGEQADDEDWVEVDGQQYEAGPSHSQLTKIPLARKESIGTASFQDALEHPHHNAERIQLVLKTMTNKLLQRKRTVRHVVKDGIEGSSGFSKRKASLERLRGGKGHLRDIDWSRTSSPSLARSNDNNEALISSTDTSSTTSPSTPLSTTPLRRVGHSRHMSADGSLSKAKGILSFHKKPFIPPSTLTPTPSAETSPRSTSPPSRSSSIRRERPASISIDNNVEPVQGVRAPPPSPHQSVILRRPSQTSSPELRMTTLDQPESPRNPTRPSLSVTEATHTSSSRMQSASSHTMPDKGDANPDNLFPHEGLIRNIHRFMRYSSAAYGQNFLRILGLGSSDFMFPSTGKHHANSWAFAQHTNIPIDCLLLSSFTESSAALIQQEAPPLIHYVAVEHSLKAIVLTCRGTLGLSDVLVDLTCEYQSIDVEQGDPDANYYVHAGMWQSARKLTIKQSTVHETLLKALTKYPDYGLVLAGHSLGGGVASLLSILCSIPSPAFLEQNSKLPKPYEYPKISTPFVTNFKSGLPPGRPIHCYAYGPPAVTSIDLSNYSKGLITSVCQDSDVVPTLSLGVIKDFKNIALTLSEEGNIAEEIVGRVIGLNKRKFDFQKKSQNQNQGQTEKCHFKSNVDPEKPINNTNENKCQSEDSQKQSAESQESINDEEMLSDWMVSLIKTMRADMDNAKLFPPGMVYIMEHFDVYLTEDDQPDMLKPRAGLGAEKKVIHRQAHRVILRQCDSVEERFREPIFAKSMLQNHLPSQYERSTHLLYEGLGQGKL
ncbi:uncharacterized protein L201_005695 [Kwoniella dendrophila CBS 6074]|uniref:sn-1-specific diacylglycerol lipase n=1 Tax=Kwoniella dendrophila CBS 6074 TaxID=1295534 RepID=A0AAX4K0U2_9TREE